MEEQKETDGQQSPLSPPLAPSPQGELPRRFFWKRAGRWIALFLLLIPVGISGWIALYALQAGPGKAGEFVLVTIPAGSGIRKIGQILADAGCIDEDIRFALLAKYLGLARKIPAGEFRVSQGERPGDVLRQLVIARPVEYRITIPEGLRIEEIATLFAAGGWCDREQFIALAHDPAFIQSLKLTGLSSATSLEGYLYPDTYALTKEMKSVSALIAMQVERFRTVWEGLSDTAQQAMSRHEIVTLASVVEKETGNASERPLIAGVFFNRLKTGMRLQSDPTVIYGLKNFSGDLTRNDLKNEHPYNTYVIAALPAGPICNPGQQALAAVLHPEPSDFFYFVAKNNGSHHFSKNLTEHNQAVWTYQRGGKQEKKE